MKNSRDLALQILSRVEADNAYINVLLDTELQKASSLDPRDKSLITELVYGVVRWQRCLDWYLDQVCKKPMRKTKPWLRHILRIGGYQLLMLDKIPPSAAINESVKLAGKYHKKIGLPVKITKGVVNAVLRQLDRSRETLKTPETISNAEKRLSVQYSYPEWMVRRWIQRLGVERTEEVCRIQNQPPLLTLRVNTLKTSCSDVQQQLIQEVKTLTPLPGDLPGFALSGHPPISELACFRQGECTLQNASSMLVSLILDPKPWENILEACSGSGIKTTHIGELMKNRGKITAVDLYEKKLQRLQDNCRRLGITIVQTYCGDMTTFIDLPAFHFQNDRGFHRVLVDAPCSGLGVLRKHPEAKWTKHVSQIKELQQLQLRLLTHAVTLLHPNKGVLVYSTCTTEPEENEEVISKFLRSNPEFRITPPHSYLSQEFHQYITGDGFLRIEPPQEYLDGFFCARLERG